MQQLIVKASHTETPLLRDFFYSDAALRIRSRKIRNLQGRDPQRTNPESMVVEKLFGVEQAPQDVFDSLST